MVITLKIIICIFLLAIGIAGYSIFRMFKDSIDSEDYDNISLLGKLLNQLLFTTIAAGLLSLISFLSVVLFSTITIS